MSELQDACKKFKARRDPFALIESGAFKIRTKAGMLIPLTPETMHPFQRRAYYSVKEQYQKGKPVRQIWLKSRQMGGSTLAQLIVAAVTMCNDNYNSLVLSNIEDTATWIFNMGKLMQEEMEARGQSWLKLKNSSKKELIWEGTRSAIRIGSAESKNIGITETRQAVHGSEVAYYRGWPEIWANLSPSIPYLPRTIVILESTANGSGDHFHQLWQASVRGESGFTTQFFPWYENEEYAIEPPPGFAPTEEEQELAAQYDLSPAQLYWRRCKVEQDFAGNVDVFREKYPGNPEEAFRTTGSIVFSDLRQTLDKACATLPPGRRMQISEGPRKPVLTPDEHGPVELFEEYQQGRSYVMYSDVGEGLKAVDTEPVIIDGKRIDTTYSTCSVRRASDWALCALLECRYPVDVFSSTAALLGRYFAIPEDAALWGIEIPGPGQAVIAWAQQMYPLHRLYKRTWRTAQNEYREQSEYGFRNDARSKPILESDWAAMVREHPELIGSARIAAQALTYIQDERTGKHRPRSGCFSDLLLADMGCVQMLKVTPPEDKEFKRRVDYHAGKWEERRQKYGRRLGVQLASKMRI